MPMKSKLAVFAVVLAGLSLIWAQSKPAEAIFKRADKNGDGQVTRDEVPDEKIFAKFDLNKDGIITLEEGRQVIGSRALASESASAFTSDEPAEKLFRYLDKNNDGAITENEMPPQAKRLMAVDANQDGRITRVEAIQALAKYVSNGGEVPAEATASRERAKPIITGPKVIKGGDFGVGRQVAEASFTTRDGTARTLSALAAGKGLAIAYTSTTCPVSKRYAPSLARLEKDLAAQGVALLLVDPFASEKAAELDAFIKEHGFTCPVLHDTDKAFTTLLGVRTTTEVFLLDAARTLIYRGALDDQYGLNYNLDAPRESYLREAVVALGAGQRPPIAATEAPGCELDVPSSQAKPTEITYHKDVARILQQNCFQCHHDGGIAPFGLDDVAEVTDRAKTIKRVIEQGQMPPWFAAPVADGAPNPWANDCSLSARDKADLFAWLDSANRPLGDAKDAPAPLKFSNEWSIGAPDLVLQIPKPFDIKAEGYMPYKFAIAETTLTEDKWVSAYEVMPSVREVVHHVIVQVHEKGTKVRDRGEAASGFYAAYVPGNASRVYPAGFARKLPAGCTVSFQIHYTPNGKAVQEQVKMGLVFAKTAPEYEVKTLAVTDHQLNIPPGVADHMEWTERTTPFEVNAMAFVAHMHVRGKSFRYDVTLPDGTQETLLDIPRYDFNWQLRYEYKQPRTIPAGSKVRVTAVFDNSVANKANPDSTKTVKWGQQTYEEMMIGYIEYFTPITGGVAMK